MSFQLDEREVENIRRKYKGVHADSQEILETAEYIQDNYLPHSAAIGNLTTIEGAQSTKTRRPLSASVDLVVEETNGLEDLGEDYQSWQHMGAYFADVNNLEVGVIHTREFPLWDFPDEILDNRYEDVIQGCSLVLAESGSNFASKVNRMLGGEIMKDSDAVDLGSHLHWAYTQEKGSIEEIARRVDQSIDGSYMEALRKIGAVKDNFNVEETKELDNAISEFETFISDQ